MAKSAPSKQRAAKRQWAEDNTRRSQTVVIPTASRAERVRRRRLEADPPAWIWESFGPASGLPNPLTRPFTDQDLEMIEGFFQCLKFGGDELTLCSRGGGKTSRLRECITLALLSGVLKYAVYFAATGGHAARTSEFVRHAVCESRTIRTLYREVSLPAREANASPQKARGMLATGREWSDGRKTFSGASIGFEWSADRLVFPRVPGSPSSGAILESYGLDSAVRGLNTLGVRPDGLFIDDPDTPITTNRQSHDQAQKVVDRINYDLGGLRAESSKMCRIMLATLSRQGSGVAWLLSGDDSPFVLKRHRLLLREPDHLKMWTGSDGYVELRKRGKSAGDKFGRKAHEHYLDNQRKMDAGSQVANPHRFDSSVLPDGSQVQVSALQNYFDDWADKGEDFCLYELQNERVEHVERITVKVDPYRVAACAGNLPRGAVLPSTTTIVRGVDVRKTELHSVTLAVDGQRKSRIVDYDVQAHGTTETSVMQAERLILDGLHRMTDDWQRSPPCDENGTTHTTSLTLIDKGWLGSWTEDGEWKSWASQPVETFCLSEGLTSYLAAKGAPNYSPPAPAPGVFVGDNWHLNRGRGKNRTCDEIIWNADHWHLLVEELFMLGDDDPDRFELFDPSEGGIWANHKSIGEHITAGASQLKEQMARGTRSKKPRFIRDHWWDSLAMALVARSIVEAARQGQPQRPPASRQPPPPSRFRRSDGRPYLVTERLHH